MKTRLSLACYILVVENSLWNCTVLLSRIFDRKCRGGNSDVGKCWYKYHLFYRLRKCHTNHVQMSSKYTKMACKLFTPRSVKIYENFCLPACCLQIPIWCHSQIGRCIFSRFSTHAPIFIHFFPMSVHLKFTLHTTHAPTFSKGKEVLSQWPLVVVWKHFKI